MNNPQDANISSKNHLNELIHHYEVRMLALSSYSELAWNRFNWFLTLQIVIIGFFFSQIERIAAQQFLATAIPSIGLIVTMLWLLMGFEDFRSLRRHKEKIKNSDELLEASFKDVNIIINDPKAMGPRSVIQTKLLFVFPFLTITAWVLILTLYGL